jgi:hypothetical protein
MAVHHMRAWCCLFAGIFALLALGLPARIATAAAPYSEADLAKLTPEQQERLTSYLEARAAFNEKAEAYWGEIKRMRAGRQKKRAAGEDIDADDYVLSFPPAYSGPHEPVDIIKLLQPPKAVDPPKPIPVVADFLKHAKAQYGFEPERVNEDEFMRRYARTALALGFSPEQIVRVYALETGGLGTHDMQSGVNPVTKKGRAISTALGYAQLLDANTIEMVIHHAPSFATQLEHMAAAETVPARAKILKHKAAVLRRMHQIAHAVGVNWNADIRFGKTAKGQGIHAINLDGHIGPWLQVNKLKSIREYAAKHGMENLAGSQLELMNLAGPARGLEMMQPYALEAPTANFFERQGYERNPVVHNKTAAQLLAKLNEIMDKNMQRDGSRRFLAIFAEVGGRAARN